MAAKSALPPADYKLKSVTEIQSEQNLSEDAFNKAHPEIALWRSLRTELTGAGGADYFSKNMKEHEVPNLKGKVVAQPSPKELTVSIDDVTTETLAKAEATLVFDSPLKGTVEPGTELTFAGSPTAYTKEPFMVTMDVEKKNVNGLGAAAGPATPTAPRRAPARSTRKK